MDSAKNAVQGFLSKSGKHDTSVHESIAPAVTNETVNQHRHENVTTAVDREVHQDHYHTTVQPIHHKEKLAEQHHHNMAEVEHRKFEHGNDDEVQRRLAAEKAQFKDTTTKGETKHTSSNAPQVTGEHIHHHVHEQIQPVINRQTIEQHVVHTTVPIHETHHSAAQHHGTTALPAVSLADFQKQGGSLGGREQRSDFFEGEPRSMTGHTPHRDGDASSEFRKTGHVDTHGHSSGGSGLTGSSTTGSSGVAGDRGLTGQHGHHHNGTDGTVGSGLTGSSTTGGSTGLGKTGATGSTGSGLGNTASGTTTGTGSSGLSSSRVDDTTTTKKPSLLDRLNPMKDTDGDGKKGMMD